jgi:hypothetical protein
MNVRLATVRSLAGATALVVPSSIAVHLGAEAFALGGAGAEFWLRHAYLAVPLLAALWSFARTVGLGRSRAEMVRRCALVRARMRVAGGGSTIAAFALANAAIFGISQLVEGVPIASGSLSSGLIAAAAGSLLSALVIFIWGRSLVATALAAAVRRPRLPCRRAFAPRSLAVPGRAAAATFTLFVPNRPPPVPSPA